MKTATEQICERCGEHLNDEKAVTLELNQKTGLFCEPGTVPPEDSQGAFSFGVSCARNVLKNGGRNQRIKRAAK